MFKNRGIRIRPAPESIRRLKARLRELTRRSRSQNPKEHIRRINAYLRGWVGYFALAETPSTFEAIEGWLRRRLRACLWTQWKRVRTRVRELRALGLPDWVAKEFANSRKGATRMASGPLNWALDNTTYWRAQGLISLTECYRGTRQA